MSDKEELKTDQSMVDDHPEEKDIHLNKVLAALGDPIRLQIVSQVAKSKKPIKYGDFDFDIGNATLSYHLKTLRVAGLIWQRRVGTRCYISLRKEIHALFPQVLKSILKNV